MTISQNSTGNRRSSKSGFSLIELLIVIAITSVLIFLIFGPLLQGFKLTARTQTTTQAQDTARVAMEQISREIGSASAIRDTSHQFLHLELYRKDGKEVVANSYNAYMDIVPPRASAGTYVDPTYNPSSKTIVLNSPTGTSPSSPHDLTYSGATLPVAPGTTLVRYFIGLRYPVDLAYTGSGATAEQPYTNPNEGQGISRSDPTFGSTMVVKKGLDNTYILYRAEVEPFAQVTVSPGKKQYEANPLYFDKDSFQNPILDDPDFFRITGDSAHNARVYHWFQAAKPIIDVGDANLIFQPHDANGNVVYDGTTLWPADTQTDFDGSTPILRTSVSFAPATISNDPLNATATSDVSQGYGTSPADSSVFTYIPSEFKAQYGQWHGGPNVQITQNSATPTIFNTYVATAASPPAPIVQNDLVEAIGSTNVYDVTTQTVLNAQANYVAMTVDGDAGVVNFALPDLPDAGTKTITSGNIVGSADIANAANPYWFLTYAQTPNASYQQTTNDVPGAITLHIQVTGTPSGSDPALLQNATTLTRAATVPNGHVVINSERVYGPEEDAGPTTDVTAAPGSGVNPAAYGLVPYRRIPFTAGADSTIKADEYMIDYDTGIIYFGQAGTTLDLSNQYVQRRTVLVAYSYQNNIIPGSSPFQPDTVRVTYQTGSQMEISLGIRVYDPSDKHPTYFSLTNRVGVGNATR